MMWHWWQCQWHQVIKMSCCTFLQLSLPKECYGTIFDTIGMMWCLCYNSFWLSWLNKYIGAIVHAIGIMWPKSHVASLFNHQQTNGMVSLMTLLASYDTDTSISGITWPKGYVAPHFSHLDLRNAVVPLMMPLASCDQNCCISFWLSWPKRWNGVIDNTLWVMWHWH